MVFSWLRKIFCADDEVPPEQRLVDLMNAERVKYNLEPLARDQRLDATAFAHNNLMALDDTCAHQLRGELPLVSRIESSGYKATFLAENVSAGIGDPERVFDFWMKEEPPRDSHKRAILSPAMHCGVCHTSRPRGRYQDFWTVDFAAPN